MNTESIQEQFNFVANEYDSQRKIFIPCFEDYYKTMTSFFCSILRGPESILDLGAGTGLLTKIIYDHFPNSSYTLVDVSNDMLEIAKKRFAGLCKFNYEIMDYSRNLPEKKYDLITSALSIHHLMDSDKEWLYKKVYGLLPESGWFINFDQFNPSSNEMNMLYNNWWYNSIKNSGLPGNEYVKWLKRRELDRENTIEETKVMLINSGFKLVECIYSFMKFGVIIAKKEDA